MKRKTRRDRGDNRQLTRIMDKVIANQINGSFGASMATWGATRCGGCGIQVRPSHLVDHSGFFTTWHTLGNGQGYMLNSCGHISCFPVACSNIACPGEIDDWMDLVAEGKRK